MKKTKKNGLEIYQCTTKGIRELRWRVYRSGRKITGSTEGYRNLRDLEANLLSCNQMTYYSLVQQSISNYKNRKK